MAKTETKRQHLVAVSELFIIFVSVMLLVIGYGSNEHFVFTDESNTTISVGLWHCTRCQPNGTCDTKTRNEFKITSVYYSYDSEAVGYQVTVTLGLILAVVAACLYCKAVCIQTNTRRYQTFFITCALVSEGLTLVDFLSEIIVTNICYNYQIYQSFKSRINDVFTMGMNPDCRISAFLINYCWRQVRNQTILKHGKEPSVVNILFPWGLAILNTGTVVLVAVTLVCCINELYFNKSASILSIERWSTLFKFEVCTCVLTTCLQIAGHSSNSLFISTDKRTGEEQRIGVWYITVCDKSTACYTVNRYRRLEDLIQQYDILTGEFTKSVIIGLQTVMTLTLVLAMVTCVFYILAVGNFICKRTMRTCVIISASLSGSIVLDFCGQEATIQYLMAGETDSYTSLSFPWALLLIGLSGILSLTLVVMCLLREYFSTNNDSKINISYIRLK